MSLLIELPLNHRILFGGYLQTSSEVSSGNNERKPDSMVLVRVESAGDHSGPFRNKIRSTMVVYGVVLIAVGMVYWMTSAAYAYCLVLMGGGSVYTSISQSWVAGLAGACQDNFSGAQDLNCLRIKGGGATSIAQLADG